MTVLVVDESKYDAFFKKYGEQYKVDPLFLKAQVKQESEFNPLAVSKCGAKGLAQFMPLTWRQMGHGDIQDPESNIKAQADYMHSLIYLFRGDTDKALAAYNWGMGNVMKLKTFALSYLPEETHHYIMYINKYYAEYKTRGAL